VTDDSIMARSVARCLDSFGMIDRDWLARAFASDYDAEPHRGYGGTAHGILRAIGSGIPWQRAAGRVFDGEGSCGNGAAMRAAPVGAYFADDLPNLINNARASAEVTHAHPDGQAGAIAVALAAGWMVREKPAGNTPQRGLIEFVLRHLPECETSDGIARALELSFESSPVQCAHLLGSGSRVTAQDTVPFCLWCAARHPADYGDALWCTIQGMGDCDTTCAIVGGIVAAGAGPDFIPAPWLAAREPLSI
jgi:ADP-ribosylglycohydrolase